jgi:hypothetical protein
MPYSLAKVGSPHIGDSGSMSLSLCITEGKESYISNARPEVGKVIRVGSYSARTYARQDWWQTSTITEILEDSDDRVRFKTLNSEYVWERF